MEEKRDQNLQQSSNKEQNAALTEENYWMKHSLASMLVLNACTTEQSILMFNRKYVQKSNQSLDLLCIIAMTDKNSKSLNSNSKLF